MLEDNEPPAYDDNIGRTGIPLPQQAAFFAAEQAMHRLQNPRGYRPNAPPTVIARTVARATFNSKIKWNGQRETFATFQSLFEGQLHQTQCGYAIDPDFAVAFGKDQDRCLIDYPEYDITPAQLKADNHYISGAIMSSCSGTAITHCMLDRHKKNRDGILAWADCIKVYVNEETIQVKYTPGYKNGIVAFVDDYRAAFNGLFGLQCIYSDNEMRTRLVNNLWTPEHSHLVDTCTNGGYTFLETCDHIQDHSIWVAAYETTHSAARAHLLHRSPPHPMDAYEGELTVRHLLNTLTNNQRGSRGNAHPDSHNIHHTIRSNLSPDARREIKQARDAALLASGSIRSPQPAPTAGPPTPAPPTDPVPRQYTNPAERSVNTVATTVEEAPVPHLDPDPGSDSNNDVEDQLVALLTSALQNENTFHQNDRFSYHTRTITTHGDHPSRRCLLSTLRPNTFLSISDDGADTSVFGEGWHIHTFTTQKANLVGFDANTSCKSGLPIVTALTVVEHNGSTHLLRINEAVYNEGSPTTLLSEYQLREYGCIVDSVSVKHLIAHDGSRGTQCFMPNADTTIPFLVNGGLMTFQHRLPTALELTTLIPINITADQPWDPNHHYSSAHEIIPPLIDPMDVQAFTSHNARPALYFFDPSDALSSSPGYALHISTQWDLLLLPPDPPLVHAHAHLTTKLVLPDLVALQPYLGFQSLDVIRHTLANTTQLAKAFYRFPLRRHVKARFPQLNRPRLRKKVATGTFFANCRGDTRATCAQVFYGLTSHMITVYGMSSESGAPAT